MSPVLAVVARVTAADCGVTHVVCCGIGPLGVVGICGAAVPDPEYDLSPAGRVCVVCAELARSPCPRCGYSET